MDKTHSPIVEAEIVQDEKVMSFPSALVHVISGSKVTKLDWQDPESYVFLNEGFLCIHKSTDPEKESPSLIVREVDLVGRDWYVI